MIIYLFIYSHTRFLIYLITCIYKFFNTNLDFLSYKNTLKKFVYIIFFIKNKNISHTVDPDHLSKCLVHEKCKDENIIIYEFKLTFPLRINQSWKVSAVTNRFNRRKKKNKHPLNYLSNFMIVINMSCMSSIHGICRPDTTW